MAAYNERGIAYVGLGEYQRAIPDYDEAIRLDPRYALAHANRAKNYTLLGMDPEAAQDVERAVELGRDRDALESAIEELKKDR